MYEDQARFRTGKRSSVNRGGKNTDKRIVFNTFPLNVDTLGTVAMRLLFQLWIETGLSSTGPWQANAYRSCMSQAIIRHDSRAELLFH
jgi:hypothetical protein